MREDLVGMFGNKAKRAGQTPYWFFRDDAQYAFHLENFVRQLCEPVLPLSELIAMPSLPTHYLAWADRLRAFRNARRADLDHLDVITNCGYHRRFNNRTDVETVILAK